MGISIEITDEANQALARLAEKFCREDDIFQVNVIYRRHQTIPEKTLTIVKRKEDDEGYVRFFGLQNDVALWSFNGKKLLCEYDEYSAPIKFKFNSQKAYKRRRGQRYG